MIAPLRSLVRAAIERAWERSVAAGTLPESAAEGALPSVEVERPADPGHGDFASNLALKLARPYRMAPQAIAGVLVAELGQEAGEGLEATPVASAEVAGPGFLNLRLADYALETTVAGILDEPTAWGTVAPLRPRSVNVEFVSANPTGPLHVGNARGAFVGDLLCRVLEAGGQRVTREYYFNDVGGQIPNLGASIAAVRRGQAVPEDGYHGAYVQELAAAVPETVWASATATGADTSSILGHWAAGRVREGIERSLAALGVRFDVWTTEASLHEGGWSGPSTGSERVGMSMSRTARSGSARPTSGTTRTA